MPPLTPVPLCNYGDVRFDSATKKAFSVARSPLGIIALVGFTLAFSGCAGSKAPGSTVQIPEVDDSPPISTLQVKGPNFSLLLTSGSEPEALSLGNADSLLLIATGEDSNGGIKTLSLIGNLVATCRDTVTGKISTRPNGFLRKSYLGSHPKIRGPIRKSSQFVLRAHDLTAICKGQEVSQIVGHATVSAINFRGDRTTSSRLEFRMMPVKPLQPLQPPDLPVTLVVPSDAEPVRSEGDI